MKTFWSTFSKRKDITQIHRSELARVLTLCDLIGLGLGSTLGLGMYVLAGAVAHEVAGPSVILSFVIAAFASSISGICYAEFASRVPRAGSAYVYSYVTIGEFVAFSIGWNLVLEYAIGTSSVARGLSNYFFALIEVKMDEFMKEYMPFRSPFLADYPDFLSGFVIIVLTVVLALGVKESSVVNNILTIFNVMTIGIVIFVGCFYMDFENWAIPAKDVPDDFGTGGFFPYTYRGVLEGAARCFYGFVGFDCVATTGEEAINPQRNIPLAILISLLIIFLAYFGVSCVLTLMVPYFEINPHAPLMFAFEDVGLPTVKWVVAVGALCALWASLLGTLFPMPRILYSMGSDRVLFSVLGKVNGYTHTPLVATLTTGIFAAVMAVVFDLKHLIDMMSIGTLIAYTMVAICVIILRYEDPEMVDPEEKEKSWLRQLYNGNRLMKPNYLSANIARVAIVLYSIACFMWCLFSRFLMYETVIGQVSMAITTLVMFALMFIIFMQPVTTMKLGYKVWFVPFIPCLSIFANLFLMIQLDRFTWMRIVIWLVFGYLIYFTYSVIKYFWRARLHRLTSRFRHSHHLRYKQIECLVVKSVKKLVMCKCLCDGVKNILLM